MKKSFILTVVCFLTALLVFNCTNNSPTSSDVAKNDSLQSSIDRGEYIVHHVAICLDCHSERNFNYFAGPLVDGTEGKGGVRFDNKMFAAIPGAVYPRNITSDTATGIGGWTDEEVIRAITKGISKNGDTLFPIMPYPNYNKLAKQDILDIVAYIRTLEPVNNKVPQRELMIPISMAYPPNLYATLDNNIKPTMNDRVKYGEYLVTMADCAGCHTPFDEKGQPGELLTGGNTFHLPTFTVTTANLTPDSATGIGAWTEEMFLNKFKNYRDKEAYLYDPKDQNSIMPWPMYAKMDDADLKAIYAYLRTLNPASHKIEKHPSIAMK